MQSFFFKKNSLTLREREAWRCRGDRILTRDFSLILLEVLLPSDGTCEYVRISTGGPGISGSRKWRVILMYIDAASSYK